MRVLQLVALLLTWNALSSAQAAPCRVPDDGNDLIIHPECPRLQWQEQDGALHIPDAGEFLFVTDAGTLFVTTKQDEVPEPYRTMYRTLRRGVPTRAPERDPGTPIFYATSPYTAAIVGQRIALREAVSSWQQTLYTATRDYLEAVSRPYPHAIQTLGFAYEPARSLRFASDQAAVRQALAKVQQARRKLLDELPSQAKDAGVSGAALAP